ncbi:MAG: hypothetical protein OXF06_13085 [Bacteroidetes bacterium]|nr:hypothetical protein [Bacteroidota bacterium]MCY4225751.1 hypothetical protein [Bacteroidota bacterium]
MDVEKKYSAPPSSTQQTEPEIASPSSTVSRGSVSLRRLRDRVQILVKELDRLRNENQDLTQRILELESSPKIKSRVTSVNFEENREELLARVNSFIQTIDDYLIKEDKKSD